MLDGYKLAKVVIPVDSTDSGEFFMAPVKGFKKTDGLVIVEPGKKETIYTTATGSITAKMPKHSEPLNWKRLVNEEAIESVWMNPELLIKALEPYAKAKTPVKIDFLGKLKGINIASADAKSFVLPVHPADNAHYMEF